MTAAAGSPPETTPELRYQVLRVALERFETPPAELEPARLEEARRLARRQYELELLVLGSVEACDVLVPEPVWASALAQIEARYSGPEEFLDDLTRNGIDVAGLRAALHRELKVEAVLERVGSRAATVGDVDITIYYHMHKHRFHKPETRTARHILITINPDFPENRRAAALARIETIAQRVRRKPKRFAEQAQKYSECPTAMHCGMLGQLPRGQLYPELDAALFSLDPGRVSETIESSLGFHLLLCEAVHPAGPISLKEARPRIREILKKRGRRMCQRSWLAGLVSHGKATTRGERHG